MVLSMSNWYELSFSIGDEMGIVIDAICLDWIGYVEMSDVGFWENWVDIKSDVVCEERALDDLKYDMFCACALALISNTTLNTTVNQIENFDRTPSVNFDITPFQMFTRTS